jgi:hypothetical protein
MEHKEDKNVKIERNKFYKRYLKDLIIIGLLSIALVGYGIYRLVQI